jgi:hypothetical protein
MNADASADVGRTGLSVGLEIAERLRSPDHVRSVVCRAGNTWPPAPDTTARRGIYPWTPESLASGHPGAALLHLTLADHDPSFHRAAHAHLDAAVAALRGNTHGGLAGGCGSIAFVAAIAASATGGYEGLLGRLEPALATHAEKKITYERWRLHSGGVGTAWDAYDAIIGLAGVGRLLLMAVDAGRTVHLHTLRQILAFLCELTDPIVVDGHRVPGWWTPPERYLSAYDRRLFPGGDFNVGLAHGICGPLALLATALIRGVEVPRQVHAMGRILDWLALHRAATGSEPAWPPRVGWDTQIAGARALSAHVDPPVASWCYGTAGVARAIQLAGRALRQPSWEETAVAALRAALQQPAAAVGLGDATFCHGTAGLLQASWRVATDTGDSELAVHAARLAGEILASFDPDVPFGFQHLAPRRSGSGEPHWKALDIAGALDGAAGVALTLVTATRSVHVGDDGAWDAAFLLS